MTKKLLSLLAGAALALTLFPAGAATAASVELNYAIFFPATHGHTLLATEWAKEVEKRTAGAVKVNIFAGATLIPADQTYDGVVKGIADVGMSVLSYSKGRFPLTEVLDLPLGYTSGLQATRLANAYYRKFQPKELADVKIMYLMAHGPGILHTKKPVEKLEDLAGMKIRGTGTSAKIVAALGATPVAMPQNEAYDALQKGVVEGLVSPIETLKGWKYAEVVKYTTRDLGASYSVGFFVAMNRAKWDALPQAAQAAIEAVNAEWVDKVGKAWDDFDKAGAEFALSKGVKIIELPKAEDARWAEKVKPMLGDYVAATKGKGLPGEEALAFVLEWLKVNP